jgi:hypothetical protein
MPCPNAMGSVDGSKEYKWSSAYSVLRFPDLVELKIPIKQPRSRTASVSASPSWSIPFEEFAELLSKLELERPKKLRLFNKDGLRL